MRGAPDSRMPFGVLLHRNIQVNTTQTFDVMERVSTDLSSQFLCILNLSPQGSRTDLFGDLGTNGACSQLSPKPFIQTKVRFCHFCGFFLLFVCLLLVGNS